VVQNEWTPAVLTGPAFERFVAHEFEVLRAVMVQAGLA
jgi:putative tricarboxylic transport membrane protein